jgi:hypothetical protein
MQAGAAIVDITPPAGLAMSGFGARTAPAIGAHDPLTARAVAVDDTAIVCADVIGLHEATCARIRARCCLPEGNVVVAALHTHGGPVCMPGRLGGPLDARYLARLEDGCVRAIDAAVAARTEARLEFGTGKDPGVARNRRHAGGITDPALPVLRLRARDGTVIAVVASYACHPVVLASDNLLWTADYPGVVRAAIERQHPGAIALFLTGCCGEANTGHTVQASNRSGPQPDRTFATAGRIGERVALQALTATMQPLTGPVSVVSAYVALLLARRETEPLDVLAQRWRKQLPNASPSDAPLLRRWIDWAERVAPQPLEPWMARVSVLHWCGVRIAALPGEIFAATALSIRAALDGPVMTLAYADGVPGYIPPAGEYRYGGYEVDEAHRIYGMPATFAPGGAERLAEAAIALGRAT